MAQHPLQLRVLAKLLGVEDVLPLSDDLDEDDEGMALGAAPHPEIGRPRPEEDWLAGSTQTVESLCVMRALLRPHFANPTPRLWKP